MTSFCDVGLNELTSFLREAKHWHSVFEARHGTDPHWEPFYASFIRSRLFGLTEQQSYDYAMIDVLGSRGL